MLLAFALSGSFLVGYELTFTCRLQYRVLDFTREFTVQNLTREQVDRMTSPENNVCVYMQRELDSL
jgi:hypothetical protein